MSLEHAILGFLNYRQFSGYDLKEIFDTSVHHFWPADQSQIYRTLNKLMENGWASVERVEQEKRPDRKEYLITGEGQKELAAWLLAPQVFGDHRSPVLIQVFFAGQLTDEQVIEMFERVAEYMRMGLAAYDQIPQTMEDFEDYCDSPREFYFWMLTLEIGRNQAQANLDWIENMIEKFKNGDIPKE